MKQYHISHDGEELGPYSAEEIAKKVQGKDLSPMDYIYDESAEDWVPIVQFQEVAGLLHVEKPKPKSKPAASPKAEASHEDHSKPDVAKEQVEVKANQEAPVEADLKAVSAAGPEFTSEQAMSTEWYVLKGENKFGPFAYTDVLKMLQQKIVFEFDFAWHPGLATWKRIAELDAFHADNISKIKETLMPEISEVFFRRKHRRVEFDGTVLIHNNAKVWKGQGVEISTGGVGIVIENALLVPGDEVIVHFKPAANFPAFNASCEIVSKKSVEGLKDKNAPVKYGLKFTGINKQMQEMLQTFSKTAAPSAA
ncbi:MAG: GYF domain-containing protein [Pseudomonadota bacterium]